MKIVVAACVVAWTGLAAAQSLPPAFADLWFTTGSRAMRAVPGDFDGDGHVDLLLARLEDDPCVLLGDGADGFGLPLPAAVGEANDAAVGDFNADGKLDAIAYRAWTDTVQHAQWTALLGDGQGALLAGSSGAAGFTYVPRVVAGDLDGDGREDFLLSGLQSFFGDGASAFHAGPALALGSEPQELALADVDGDGDLDLVALIRDAPEHPQPLEVLHNDGTGAMGSLQDSGVPIFVGDFGGLAVADLDADGTQDFMVSGVGGVVLTQLLLGDGQGGAASEQAIPGLWGDALADVDGDGRLDIIGEGSNSLVPPMLDIALGDGAGGAAAPLELGVGPLRHERGLMLDGDGRSDVVCLLPDQATLTVVPGRAATEPRTVQSKKVPGGWSTVRAGDVDGDGAPDLLVSQGGTFLHGFQRFLNDDGGGFGAPSLDLTTSFDPGAFLLLDRDGDGDLDVLALARGDKLLHVLNNSGGNHINELTSFSLGAQSSACLVAADLDGDGIVDVATGQGGTTAPRVTVVHGVVASGYGFSPPATTPLAGDDPHGIAAGDLDSDGWLDLVTCNRFDKSLSVLRGSASGFLPEVQYEAGVGQGPAALVLSDFDGDGVLDAATANQLGDNASVLRGDGAGGFLFGVKYALSDEPVDIAAADFDGDGDTDLAVSCVLGRELAVLAGDGAGDFTLAGGVSVDGPLQSIFFGYDSASLALADLDLDGQPDLAYVNYDINGDGALDVRLNIGPAPFIAPWTDLGGALAGSLGAPRLTGQGSLTAAASCALRLDAVPPAAPAVLFAALGVSAVPFKGGTLQAFPPAISLLLSTGAGSLTLPFTWPAGIPAGVHFVFQCAVQDGAAVHGVSLSNGLGVITP